MSDAERLTLQQLAAEVGVSTRTVERIAAEIPGYAPGTPAVAATAPRSAIEWLKQRNSKPGPKGPRKK